MGVLSDRQIEKLAEAGMITPYSPMQRRPGVISYGVSSMGYDVRLGYKFKVFKSYPHDEIDPKAFNPDLLEDVDLTPQFVSKDQVHSRHNRDCPWNDPETAMNPVIVGLPCACSPPMGYVPPNFIRIPPHSFALGESLEWFDIPRDLLVVCLGKSTYARCGLIVNVTPGEPEWPGHWTIEISNTTPLPMRVYAGEGIMQCLFFRSDEVSDVQQKYLSAVIALLPDNVDKIGLQMKFMDQLGHGRVEGRMQEKLYDWMTNGSMVAGCGVSYKDKKGKYVGQAGLTLPKVD